MGLKEKLKETGQALGGLAFIAGAIFGLNVFHRACEGDYSDRTECCEELDCWFYKPVCASTTEQKYFTIDDDLCITNSEGKKECCSCYHRESDPFASFP